MFSIKLDISLCYPYWFISTIVQFYLFWPLIIKVYRMQWGGQILLVASLLWSTLVGLLGLEEARPWGSFFLQYLWEFALGMWIAEKCTVTTGLGERLMDIKTYKWWWLVLGAAGGMGLSAIMAWNGGVLQLYNDIPSLVGYLSVALLVYKSGIKMVTRFFEWANSFSYELYLTHSLVFTIIAYMVAGKLATYMVLMVSFVAAYIVAYLYRWLTRRIALI
jgi:peptidoglycan/LPS O-acetylase OafA/YrhL